MLAIGEDIEHLLAESSFTVFPSGAAELLAFDQDAREDLRPAAGRGTQVNNTGHIGKEIEFWRVFVSMSRDTISRIEWITIGPGRGRGGDSAANLHRAVRV